MFSRASHWTTKRRAAIEVAYIRHSRAFGPVPRSPHAHSPPFQATEDEIKAAWRKQALLLHPDRQRGDSQAFQALQQAYECLSDRASRAEYDKALLHRLYLEVSPHSYLP